MQLVLMRVARSNNTQGTSSNTQDTSNNIVRTLFNSAQCTLCKQPTGNTSSCNRGTECVVAGTAC